MMQQMKNLNFSILENHGVVVLTRLGLTVFLLVGLLSCGNLGYLGINAIGANITQIQDLKPQQNDSTTVYVQGKVEKQVPLLDKYAYQINDSTGKIWVVTNQTGLREGAQVVIKGKLRYPSIPLGGKEYGEVYLEEE
ncbi:hypothetical protein [Brasilonema sp. UFV-L1]|uniref:hypothetical protein n=2 Tax=Brasilonema sp. UFV-L1 TaxID=2234130 RepID=UPI0030D95E5B